MTSFERWLLGVCAGVIITLISVIWKALEKKVDGIHGCMEDRLEGLGKEMEGLGRGMEERRVEFVQRLTRVEGNQETMRSLLEHSEQERLRTHVEDQKRDEALMARLDRFMERRPS